MMLYRDYCHSEKLFFSFFFKFVLAQFKSIPAGFKYCRDSNGLKILFHTPMKTDARIHSTGCFLCIGGLPNFAYEQPKKTLSATPRPIHC